jgi:hypothetical protein
MSDSTKRRFQRPTLDSYPAPIPPDQDGLPFAQDGADESEAPDVQADADAVLDSQASGLAMPGADAAKAVADPFNLESLRLSQDFASAVGLVFRTPKPLRPSCGAGFR